MSAFSCLNFPPLPPIPQQSMPLRHSAKSQNNNLNTQEHNEERNVNVIYLPSHWEQPC